MSARGSFFLCAVLGSSLFAASARAQVCSGPAGAPPAAPTEIEPRLDFLAAAFDREILDIDIWSWTWGSVYVAGTLAEGTALALTKDPGTKTDLTVGVVATAFGAASLSLLPLKLTLPLRASRDHWGDADRCELLAHAERTLLDVESNQAIAVGPLGHIGNVAINLGLFLILGLGYHQWVSGALSGGIGVAVGEANAFTQPHHLREVLARYRTGQLAVAPPVVAWSVAPVFARSGGGAALTLAW